jgi:hypothetical protein
MARVQKVERAQKDYPEHGIKKGEPYWWWKFRFGGKHYSKTPPRQSQLTQSGFLSQVWGLEEQLADMKPEAFEDAEALKDERDSLAEEIRQAGEECSEKRDNMPDSLQDSETGELLQSRADECESFADELEAVDLEDYEGPEPEEGKQKPPELTEWLEGKIDELQGCSYGGE